MLIGYEAKRLFRNFTGLGNYCRFVIGALSEFYQDHQYYLFTPSYKPHPEVDNLISRKNISVIAPPTYYPSVARSAWRSWGIGREGITKDLQIFHGLSQELPFRLPKKIATVVTVHDLIYLRYPQFYNIIDVKIYKAKLASACKRADKIVAISKQTADDLVELMGVNRSKIAIVYQGCHSNFNQETTVHEREEVQRKYNLPPKYLLNVGTVEIRKNALLIVKAISLIPESARIPLVIIGRHTTYTNSIVDFVKKNNLERWVKFIDKAAFTDFPAIYQGAELFIYPSLIEGFGIPLVEAITSGVPVITATSSALREAAGPASVFVEPTDEQGLAKEIERITGNADVRISMIAASKNHIQKFIPKAIADEMMLVYQALL